MQDKFVMLIFVTIYYFKLIHVINKILHFVLQCNQNEIMDDDNYSQSILTHLTRTRVYF